MLYQVDVLGVGPVTIQKRKGTSSIRMRLLPSGEVRVSMPHWLPKQTAIDFVRQRADWINQHKPVARLWRGGEIIGKQHTLRFAADQVSRCRVHVGQQTISITYPQQLPISASVVQAAAGRGINKALIMQSPILTDRLAELAARHGFAYRSVSFRFMRSKWGHCSSRQEILLNYQLLTLPDELIDYVLLHELTHTKYMNHGHDFWDHLGSLIPNLTVVRKQLRTHRTS